MQLFVKVYKNKYTDSLETLYTTSVVTAIEGVETAYVAMANKANKDIMRELELYNDEVDAAKDGDLGHRYAGGIGRYIPKSYR